MTDSQCSLYSLCTVHNSRNWNLSFVCIFPFHESIRAIVAVVVIVVAIVSSLSESEMKTDIDVDDDDDGGGGRTTSKAYDIVLHAFSIRV